MSRTGTIRDVARPLHLSWDTVKEIQENCLYRHYNNPDFTGVRYIGMDEFAVAKGHIYKTIVVNLETSRVICIGDGKGADVLKKWAVKE
jgi:transposase